MANYEGDVIYQILTDRFADGDPSNNNPYNLANAYDPTRVDVNRFFGGDWRGIEDNLDYIAGMGVGAIWISPPYDNLNEPYLENDTYYNAYHGFWAKDYFRPDERWGTMSDFESLVQAAASHGIKVVIDFAPNHTNHTDSAEQGAFYRDGVLMGSHSNDTQGLFHHLGNREGHQTSMYDFQYRELANLADLATGNPDVQEYLLDAIDVWLEAGVAGIRNDATLHQTDAFRTVFSDHVNRNSGAFHFGEYYIGTPDPKYDDYRTSPERTGINILDFEYANVARDVFGSFSKDMTDLAHMLEYTADDYRYENDAVTWLDSHDKSRLASIQPNQGIFHSALAFLLVSRGTPVVYYGTEQYLPGVNGDAGRIWMNSFDTSTPAYQLISRLAQLRADSDAVKYGLTTIPWVNNDVLVMQRKFYDSVVVIALNRGGGTHNVTGLVTDLPQGVYGDYLEGAHGGQDIVVGAGGHVAPFDLGPSEIGVWHLASEAGVPAIGAVGPTQGAAGYEVTVDGSGFGAVAGSVSVGSAQAEVVCWSEDQVRFIVPEVQGGDQSVVVHHSSAGSSNSFVYSVLSGPQMQVTMHVNATTSPGEEIFVVGDVPELGSWDPDKAIGPFFNPEYPNWFLPVSLPGGQAVEFKFIKKSSSGVVWESGANRSLTTPDSGVIDSPGYYWQP
ncbi:alpha-amylase family glycosyl hydrolase [Ornithinimicrobium sp. Y1847]|uniref:alpha-amylase family glycosyl hydrolase n=1 Tax=unclassified Ornithinimicrobium TaxID=2615080 RepID=UPI003B671316